MLNEVSPPTAAPLEELFHPAVAGWFRARFAAPTEVQLQAWRNATAGRHALICAPTGSGKTLAAFLAAIDSLIKEGLARALDDTVHVLYVSPLKALSNDIEKNLQEPLCGIRDRLLEIGLPDVPIRTAVRTGDTTGFERERMRRRPPHILVTTPESLFILLTSDSGRRMLETARSVIVDELHAVAGNKRGAHLMLSLERLDALTGRAPVRIGLSATVTPVEEMAGFLMGERNEAIAIIDSGHVRDRDLALEVPRAPLSAVMANEVWEEIYDRLAELIRAHRTTLVFVNTRRLAERAARHLAERIGAEHVTAHHGSLAKEHRLRAEQRLKSGELKALIATSSLELGIDIGSIDLVCQLGSPRSIAAFLQRVGRAGHAIGAVPKGRLFPLSLDELVECAALLDSARRGELDRFRVPEAPLDVLAQQVVAEVACREWEMEELFETFRRARPYRALQRADFEQVVTMLALGYSTRRGRRGAHLHFDAVHRKLRARRGARLTAVTNAGVIPDQFDYDVVLAPEELRIGTLNEDFAFESLPGDIFQLGNTSYRILKIETGKVYVEDAQGQPPNIPFWFGEAPARTDELSQSVSRLVEAVDTLLDDLSPSPRPSPARGEGDGMLRCTRWLVTELALPVAAAEQLAQYLAVSKAALGALPTLRTIVMERFFDEVGDMHLVIHSPYGSRINRAWGLALRKRFCRQFNFELQAAALEDSIVLSLGPSHSFDLDAVKDYLKSATAREVLIQALLDAPMFAARWRWNAGIALAVKRMQGSKRRPPQFQRADSEDLLAVVFPDQLACAENLPGDREIPDHPLVQQTLRDCLHETMDLEGFVRLLERIETGEVNVITRDLTAPSPLAQAILNARPYAFLDDGAAEERRTKAVRADRMLAIEDAVALGGIDPEAVARVQAETSPQPANAEELHDALLINSFLTEAEGRAGGWEQWLDALCRERRAAIMRVSGHETFWIAAERVHEFRAVLPEGEMRPQLPTLAAIPARDEAVREILRSRMELLGPFTTADLARPLSLTEAEVNAALSALEAEGAILRGNYSGSGATEWCERRLLARIHRYARERRHREVQPVSAADFMRFLLHWHPLRRSDADERRLDEAGLLAALRQLEGCLIPAGAWEEDILPARVKDYLPSMLDRLCATGRIAWCRPAPKNGSDDPQRRAGPIRTTPILLCARSNLAHWRGSDAAEIDPEQLGTRARRVYESLRRHGASFFNDLLQETGLLRSEVELALGELAALGIVTCDSFAGLRALLKPVAVRRWRGRQLRAYASLEEAGRWSLSKASRGNGEQPGALADPAVEHIARALLDRYGVVFRRLLDRETGLPPWRDLYYVFRRLEARGEIRGGRFVSGFSGEQFAWPAAAAKLRNVARTDGEEFVAISAADPLNLAGVILPGEKVPALAGNRLLFRNGALIAAQMGGEFRCLQAVRPEAELRQLLIRKPEPLRPYRHKQGSGIGGLGSG